MKTLGTVLWIGAGIVLWFFMMSSMYGWWGGVGIFLGFILAPGVVLFPLLSWFMDGVFPLLYFVIWGIGVAGLFMTSISEAD